MNNHLLSYPICTEKLVLSIGMIVKNEADKWLELCLDSLKPLMSQVKTELIITDTGSSDDTVRICKRYTEHVIHFDWVNDYSAARNSNLQEIRRISEDRGYYPEWFMFFDADEIFDANMLDMIEFFNNRKKNHDFNSATYIWHNLLFEDNFENYALSTPHRITRFSPKTRFIGKIHECLEFYEKPYSCKTFAVHYGYLKSFSSSKDIKYFRYLEEEYNDLKKKKCLSEDEIIENADYKLRCFTHIFNSSVELPESDYYLLEALTLLNKYHNRNYSFPAVLTALRLINNNMINNYSLNRYELINKFFDIYSKKIYKNSQRDLLLYFIKCSIYWQFGFFKQSCDYAGKYLKAYDDCKKSDCDFSQITAFTSVQEYSEEKREHIKKLLMCLTALENKPTRTFEFFRNKFFNSKSNEEMHGVISDINYICSVLDDYSFAEKCVQNIQKAFDPSEITKNFTEYFDYKLTVEPDEFIYKIGKLPRKSDEYFKFYEYADILRENAAISSKKHTDKKIIDFITGIKNKWEAEVFSDIFYAAIRNKLNFINRIPNFITVEKFSEIMLKISFYREKFPEFTSEFDISEFSDLRGIAFAKIMFLHALSSVLNREECGKNLVVILSNKYAELSGVFAGNAYSELSLYDIDFISSEEKLGIILNLYFNTKEKSEKTAYKNMIFQVTEELGNEFNNLTAYI